MPLDADFCFLFGAALQATAGILKTRSKPSSPNRMYKTCRRLQDSLPKAALPPGDTSTWDGAPHEDVLGKGGRPEELGTLQFTERLAPERSKARKTPRKGSLMDRRRCTSDVSVQLPSTVDASNNEKKMRRPTIRLGTVLAHAFVPPRPRKKPIRLESPQKMRRDQHVGPPPCAPHHPSRSPIDHPRTKKKRDTTSPAVLARCPPMGFGEGSRRPRPPMELKRREPFLDQAGLQLELNPCNTSSHQLGTQAVFPSSGPPP